jgi:magnesium-transporting ATPase (P-type)
MTGHGVEPLSQFILDNLNVPQGRKDNRVYLDTLGGVDKVLEIIGTNIATGHTAADVLAYRAKWGDNSMPKSPSESYFSLLGRALMDTTLVILIIAASVSFAIGYWENPESGWIEGCAIFIAVFLVSNISAFNGYTKELQFRELERSSQQDQRASVFRDGQIELINPSELVVGDIIVLQVNSIIMPSLSLFLKILRKKKSSPYFSYHI